MNQETIIIISVLTCIGIISLFYSFMLLDKIIKIQYEKYREIWELDGKPIGFFWKPGKIERTNVSVIDLYKDMFSFIPNLLKRKPFAGKIYQNQAGARTIIAMKLLFSMPNWAKDDTEARRTIIKMRIFVYVWWIYCFIIFGTLLIYKK